MLPKETAKDRVLATVVVSNSPEGWPLGKVREENNGTEDTAYTVEAFKIPCQCPTGVFSSELVSFRHTPYEILSKNGSLLTGDRFLYCGISRACQACVEHQNKPPEPLVHPWMFPEKPWSRVHVDHAINFLGSDWLVLTDAYSNYPCIHQTSSTSSKATIDLLEEDFAHFGYPHTLVSDNATTLIHIGGISGMVQVKRVCTPDRILLSPGN